VDLSKPDPLPTRSEEPFSAGLERFCWFIQRETAVGTIRAANLDGPAVDVELVMIHARTLIGAGLS